mgnify:CR=1 FL=1
MTAKRARKDSWKTGPFPVKHQRLRVHHRFTAAEYARLCRGLVPEAMEDKWLIFQESDWLHFHRSWTGYCIYQVRLERDGSGWAATEVRVNRDPEQYVEEDDAADLGVLAFLIDGLLLGRDVPLPDLEPAADDRPDSMRQWSLFGRAMLGQGPHDDRESHLPESGGPSRKQRFRGCLLGLAVGDALGTTVEFRPPGTFEPVTDMVGGGPFGLEPGQWTDDMSMALCLAESLIECGGFDPADQMRRYLRWYREGYPRSRATQSFPSITCNPITE